MREQKIALIENLNNEHPDAIAIFGGALWIDNIPSLIRGLAHVISEAKYRNWHEGLAGACRTFCHMCLVDPMLVEAYMGMRFEEFLVKVGVGI